MLSFTLAPIVKGNISHNPDNITDLIVLNDSDGDELAKTGKL